MSRENLIKAIEDFSAWQAREYPVFPSEEVPGEWETYYDGWDRIGDAFSRFLAENRAQDADGQLCRKMIYIIARDNECENLIQELTRYPEWFELLCGGCLKVEEADARWQFAAYLPQCDCGEETKNLILKFAEDQNEYVCRRALMAMPLVRPDKVDEYAKLFWEREIYEQGLKEYQKMAVLTALYETGSQLLPCYLREAKTGKEKYLSGWAEKIEEELKGREEPEEEQTGLHGR